jgi:hypothetical protein
VSLRRVSEATADMRKEEQEAKESGKRKPGGGRVGPG